MSRVLIAGLPDRLAAWLAQRVPRALVEVIYTGDDALDALLEGSWSLLLLDAGVDGLDAETLLRRIRANARLRALPVILAMDGGPQGADEETMRLWVEELGVERILLHPIDRGELARHTAALLESIPRAAAAALPAAVPSAAPSAPAEGRPAMNAALAAVWNRSQGMVMERVGAVEHAVAALLAGELAADVSRAAEREAHKLAGALGTFGSQEGSRVARQLEFAFSGASQLVPGDGSRLSTLVAAMRREIDAISAGFAGAPAPEAPRPQAPPAPVPVSAPAGAPQAPPSATAAPAPAPVSSNGGSGPLLLVIGGEPARVRALEDEARGRGVRVRAVAPGEAAGVLASERPVAVLLDVSGGEEDGGGWALLAEVTARHPGVPVLVAADKDTLLDRVRALQLGAQLFLEAGIAPAEVMDAVSRVFRPTEEGGRRRVLAVDDDRTVLEALQVLLEPQGLEVHTLDSPLRFWSTLREVRPDVLVLDVEMPHLNGIELCRVVRGDHRWSALPVIFLTAHTDAETILRVFAAGADDYATKPVLGPELSARIRVRLERR